MQNSSLPDIVQYYCFFVIFNYINSYIGVEYKCNNIIQNARAWEIVEAIRSHVTVVALLAEKHYNKPNLKDCGRHSDMWYVAWADQCVKCANIRAIHTVPMQLHT